MPKLDLNKAQLLTIKGIENNIKIAASEGCSNIQLRYDISEYILEHFRKQNFNIIVREHRYSEGLIFVKYTTYKIFEISWR